MALALFLTGSLWGAIAQRVTGMGFALVSVPLYTLAYGAWAAVSLVAVVGVVICGYLTWVFRTDIDWARWRTFAIWCLVGVPLGTWIAWTLSSTVLEMTAALVMSGALATAQLSSSAWVRDGMTMRRTTGVAAGLMNTTTGLAGPPMMIYSKFSGWPTRRMVATAQPLFVVLGFTTLAARWTVSGQLLPAVPGSAWLAGLPCLVVGAAVGGVVTRVISTAVFETAVLVIAYVGCGAVAGRALIGMI